ncbi:hypothetical protein G195_001360 [Phytophthora kernoviae 00238/432]|uniref:Uncharacterized protein n=1 Tax=Phytophthora kernoviae 00238/432 TaxID=1284355 RepID=A0A8J4STQ1_9STRA|nr:hypothetical protein G195_001360 [Phytophthora kernoviae 00238/432]
MKNSKIWNCGIRCIVSVRKALRCISQEKKKVKSTSVNMVFPPKRNTVLMNWIVHNTMVFLYPGVGLRTSFGATLK